jgi:hypothetical protein
LECCEKHGKIHRHSMLHAVFGSCDVGARITHVCRVFVLANCAYKYDFPAYCNTRERPNILDYHEFIVRLLLDDSSLILILSAY